MNDNSGPKNKPPITKNWCNLWTKVDYCSYIWTIPQFYELHCRSGNGVVSPLFKSTTNDKYTWYLRLSDPDVHEDRIIDGVIYAMVEDKELCKDMLVKWRVSVINAKGEETYIRENGRYEKLESDSSSNPPFQYFVDISNFLEIDDILNKDELLLVEDTLTIFCEVYFINLMSNDPSDKLIVTPFEVEGDGLREDFERLFESKDFSDFTVSINGKKYPTHKYVLAARSKVFAAMFKQEMKETNNNLVEISDIDEKVFEEMLRYMYSGKSPNLDNMASDLLVAADKYDLEHLKYMCEHSLMNQFSIESVIDRLILADTFHAALLKNQAIQFIKLNIAAVKRTKSWSKIEQSVLLNEIFNAFFP